MPEQFAECPHFATVLQVVQVVRVQLCSPGWSAKGVVSKANPVRIRGGFPCKIHLLVDALVTALSLP